MEFKFYKKTFHAKKHVWQKWRKTHREQSGEGFVWMEEQNEDIEKSADGSQRIRHISLRCKMMT